VTPEMVVPFESSRKLNNIFRRGDQSNIWTYDKHTEIFDNASDEEKIILANRSDNNPSNAELSNVGSSKRLKKSFWRWS
jgi:hypothetical protein